MKICILTDILPLETQRALYIELKQKFERGPVSEQSLSGDELLDARLSSFRGFSTHMINILKFANIYTVRDLTESTPGRLLSRRGFGEQSLRQIKGFLYLHGLSLKEID